MNRDLEFAWNKCKEEILHYSLGDLSRYTEKEKEYLEERVKEFVFAQIYWKERWRNYWTKEKIELSEENLRSLLKACECECWLDSK